MLRSAHDDLACSRQGGRRSPQALMKRLPDAATTDNLPRSLAEMETWLQLNSEKTTNAQSPSQRPRRRSTADGLRSSRRLECRPLRGRSLEAQQDRLCLDPHSFYARRHTRRARCPRPALPSQQTAFPEPGVFLMPIEHVIVHPIGEKSDDTLTVFHAHGAKLGDSQAIENLPADSNESYNAKNKAWGFFQGEFGAYPFNNRLDEYLKGDRGFVGFSREAVEHLQKLAEKSSLFTDGHVLLAYYQ